jgi:uncharacterized protein YbjT (DUF2867 family)
MQKSAAILGASGLVGGELLTLLLHHAAYAQVYVYGRTELKQSHPKLIQDTGDLRSSGFFKEKPPVDDLFICIGTTRSKTPDLNEYKKVDYGIPVTATQWAVKNKVDKVLVVSAMGANPNSKIFYNHVKGSMEKELKNLKTSGLYLIRPSLILGKRDEFRFGERMGKVLFKIFGFLLPKKYKGVEAKDIARAMVVLAQQEDSETQIVESDAISALAKSFKNA